MEAMAECAGPDRSIVVRTEASGMLETVHMSVKDAASDSVPARPKSCSSRSIRPSPPGWDGLAIARPIVETHGGGRLGPEQSPRAAATFHVACRSATCRRDRKRA